MVDPLVLDSALHLASYNLAVNQSGYADNFLHLYLYLKYNRAPKVLLLYVSPEAMEEANDIFAAYRFIPFIGDSVVDGVIKERDPGYARWIEIPFMRYSYYNTFVTFNAVQGARYFIQARKYPFHLNGYEPNNAPWDSTLEYFASKHPEGKEILWSSGAEKYLIKIIMLAQQKNISVMLYNSPVLNEYKLYRLKREDIAAKINSLSVEYHAEYLNFDTMKIADNRRYFSSPLLTNTEGARIFSNVLAAVLRDKINNQR